MLVSWEGRGRAFRLEEMRSGISTGENEGQK